MKPRKRWIAGAIILLLVTAVVLLLFSGMVLRIAIDRGVGYVPGLTLGELHGRLATGVRIQDLRWESDDGTTVRIAHLAADWRLLPLLTGRVRIGTLELGPVSVDLPEDPPARAADGGSMDFDLPLDILVRRMTVQRVTLARGGEPLFHAIAIDGAGLHASGRVVGARDVALDWALADGPSGSLRARGRSDRAVSIELHAGDGAMAFHGTIENPLTAPALAGELRLRAFDPSAWDIRAPEFAIDADLALAGWLEDLSVNGTVRLVAEELPAAVEAELDLRWGRSLLVLRGLTARLADQPLRVEADGRIDWSDPSFPAAVLRARWQDLDTGLLSSARGQGRAELDAETIVLRLDGQFGERDDGRVEVDGTLRWPIGDDGPRGRARFAWQDLVVAGIHSPSGHGEASGDMMDWRVYLHEARALLENHPVTLTGEASGRAAAIDALRLSADAEGASLLVEGALAESLALTWRVDIPDLSLLSADIRGGASGTGTMAGTRDDPRVQADLDAKDLVVGERSFERVTLGIEGPAERLAITADMRTAPFGLSLAATGAWRDGMLSGQLTEATFEHNDAAAWHLDGARAFEAGADAARLDDGCWSQTARDHRLCLGGRWARDADTHVEVSLHRLSLAELSHWLPPGFLYEGTLDGTATLTATPDAALMVDGTLTGSAGAWRQQQDDDAIALLRWNDMHLQGALRDGTVDGELRLALADGGMLEATLHLPVLDIPAAPAMTRPLRVHLRGSFSDFDLLPALLPEVGAISGRATTDLHVDGTRAAPRFAGTVDIEDGMMTLPQLGLHLTGLELSVEGDRETLALTAAARSGEGRVETSGRFTLHDGDLRGEATLRGEDFQAINLPEVMVHLSPDLTVALDGHTVRVTGEVAVPFARIAPRDLTGVVRRSDDEVLVDTAAEAVPAERWRVHSRVRVTVGDARFEGFGLAGRITGGLTVTDEPGQPTLATGELQVQDGRYAAWGQRLEIERGRLLFTGGPLAQPGLDVRAVRRPRDVMVGVNVRGTLQEPELTLISDPPMQQAELLSWLVLGIPLQQTSGADQQLLDNATRSAGLAGGDLLAREVGRRLGISEVGIEYGAHPDQAALVIGHYLSPRVYVGYGIGIFDPEQSLRLRYHLNRLWSLEAQTSARATSTDLKYTIER